MQLPLPSPLQKLACYLFRKTLTWSLAPCLLAAILLQLSFAQSAVQPSRIHTIHVDSFGNGNAAEALRQHVIERLNKNRQLKITDNAAASDAVLRGSSNIWETGSVVINPRSNASRQTDYQGYVELIYAIQHELNYAAVQNLAGQFIKADLASITAAAASAAQPA